MWDAWEQAEQAITACAERAAWSLPDPDLVATLDAVHSLRERLAATELALVRELDARALPVAHGASSTAVWLREHWRVSIRTARAAVELARALDRLPSTLDALARGQVNTEQAAAISTAVAALPAEVGPETTAKAETALIDHAAQFEPAILRRFGERILTHVAPDEAEQLQRRLLDDETDRAYTARTLTLTPDSRSGRIRLTGWLDTEAAAIITAALDPLTKPGALDPALRSAVPARTNAGADALPHATGSRVDSGFPTGLSPDLDTGSRADPARRSSADTRDMRTAGQRRADALTDVCRRALAQGDLPDNGGDRPQVVVTMDYDHLVARTGAGTLDTGAVLSPEIVRRLACDAQIVPAVLAGDGQVLDLGRTRRLITGPLRRALVLRDGGCAFPGCDRPPRWCDGHHLRHWADGGPTSLDNAVLLCGHHHRVIHHDDWHVRLGHDRRPEFIPPAYVDKDQRPRRNTYHQRP